jgi:hypothetical protein
MSQSRAILASLPLVVKPRRNPFAFKLLQTKELLRKDRGLCYAKKARIASKMQSVNKPKNRYRVKLRAALRIDVILYLLA